ncbi:hypothetical protein ABZ085_28220, partial [Streptomyces albidoflavus]
MSETPDPTHLLIVSGGRDLPDRARAALPGLRTTVICRPEVVPGGRGRGKIKRRRGQHLAAPGGGRVVGKRLGEGPAG